MVQTAPSDNAFQTSTVDAETPSIPAVSTPDLNLSKKSKASRPPLSTVLCSCSNVSAPKRCPAEPPEGRLLGLWAAMSAERGWGGSHFIYNWLKQTVQPR